MRNGPEASMVRHYGTQGILGPANRTMLMQMCKPWAGPHRNDIHR